MKKVRIVLSAAAIVFAFGAAFATQFRAQPLIDAYEFIPATEEDPEECAPIQTACGPNGMTACSLTNGHEVRQKEETTECVTQLKRP